MIDVLRRCVVGVVIDTTANRINPIETDGQTERILAVRFIRHDCMNKVMLVQIAIAPNSFLRCMVTMMTRRALEASASIDRRSTDHRTDDIYNYRFALMRSMHLS